MQEDDPFVTVSTDIAAPPETVWRVLTEFRRYALWHPTLSLDGAPPEPEPGAQPAFRLSGGAAGDQALREQAERGCPLTAGCQAPRWR